MGTRAEVVSGRRSAKPAEVQRGRDSWAEGADRASGAKGGRAPGEPGGERTAARDLLAGIAVGPTLEALRAALTSVATSNASVLIQGEPGTGRLRLARTLHRLDRGHRPLREVGCAGLDVDGFRAAVREAGDGTLVLVGAERADAALQAELLHWLTATLPRRPRVVSTTSNDLVERIRGGRFDAELYRRLAAARVTVPPLRQRREELPLLARHFARERVGRGRREPRFSKQALAALVLHDWTGNLRELASLVERAVDATDGGTIDCADIGLPASSGRAELPPDADEEARELVRVLQRNRWNATRAAREMGISRTTLWRRMKRYSLLRSDI